MIGNVPDSTPPDSPRSSSVCPAASRRRRGLQGCQLNVIVGRTDVFDRTGPFAPRPHDLNRHRARGRPHGAHVSHPGCLRPDLRVQIPPETGTKTQVNDPQRRQQPEREPSRVLRAFLTWPTRCARSCPHPISPRGGSLSSATAWALWWPSRSPVGWKRRVAPSRPCSCPPVPHPAEVAMSTLPSPIAAC